ncbi:MAG: hypothetical protein WCV50_06180 [Patescibacteria group bacterium]|jgi:hypothetical protein
MKKRYYVPIICIPLLIIFLYILYTFFPTEFLIKRSPESATAAERSGYSPNISTFNWVHLIANTYDGNYLVVRNLEQYRQAAGFRAFPDGGIPYYLINKDDLLLVGSAGNVIWQRSYINSVAPNYQYQSKYTTKDLKISTANDLPALLKGEILAVIRWCSPNIMQIAAFNRTPGVAAQFIHPAVEINTSDGSLRTFNNPEELCDDALPPNGSTPKKYQCNKHINNFVFASGLPAPNEILVMDQKICSGLQKIF